MVASLKNYQEHTFDKGQETALCSYTAYNKNQQKIKDRLKLLQEITYH
jgi:hypothetical protein